MALLILIGFELKILLLYGPTAEITVTTHINLSDNGE